MADGFHRVAAHEAAGVADVLAEVREGGHEEALWFALSANKRHGLPMKPEDKRRAVRLLLGVEKWRGMSNAAIAKELGVSDHTVAAVRKEERCAGSQNANLHTPRQGTDGKTYDAPDVVAEKVGAALADPANADKSSRAIAKELGVSNATVSSARKKTAALAEEKAPAPAPPAKHPALSAIEQAADPDALDAAFTAADRDATLADKEAVGAAYQKRKAELRTTPPAATPPPAPPPAQTSLLADDDADDLRAEASRWLKRLAARLAEGFTVADLKRAADGATRDDWLMGRAQGVRAGGHRDVETVYRDAAQVERLMALAPVPRPAPHLTPRRGGARWAHGETTRADPVHRDGAEGGSRRG